jgi:hypothetical protein
MNRRRSTRFILAATFVAVQASAVPAQERITEHTYRLTDGAAVPKATIADIAWMAGRWTGEGLGGVAEETWSAPAGGTMLGMFRLVREGQPVFYEIMTFREEGGSLMLRLKHFTPEFVGWEEKDKTVDFPFVGRTAGGMHFRGLTFKPEGADGLTIYLSLTQKDGSRKEEVFRMKRVS